LRPLKRRLDEQADPNRLYSLFERRRSTDSPRRRRYQL
jgi:hypothetical protein